MNQYDRKTIGRRLKSGLADKGVSHDELAESIGVSRFTVDAWAQGKVGMSLENAVAVCNYFNWPLDRLAVREESKQ